MNTFQLELGMKVLVEAGADGGPRWRWAPDGKIVDGGYTGTFAEGVVELFGVDTQQHLQAHMASIKFGNDVYWNIPLAGHPFYSKEQWKLPGFMEPLVDDQPPKNCCCGSWATYGKGKGPHAHYCDVG